MLKVYTVYTVFSVQRTQPCKDCFSFSNLHSNIRISQLFSEKWSKQEGVKVRCILYCLTRVLGWIRGVDTVERGSWRNIQGLGWFWWISGRWWWWCVQYAELLNPWAAGRWSFTACLSRYLATLICPSVPSIVINLSLLPVCTSSIVILALDSFLILRILCPPGPTNPQIKIFISKVHLVESNQLCSVQFPFFHKIWISVDNLYLY